MKRSDIIIITGIMGILGTIGVSVLLLLLNKSFTITERVARVETKLDRIEAGQAELKADFKELSGKFDRLFIEKQISGSKQSSR